MLTGKGHLREAILSHEEALRVHDLCKQMRKIDLFRDILQKMHERLDWRVFSLITYISLCLSLVPFTSALCKLCMCVCVFVCVCECVWVHVCVHMCVCVCLSVILRWSCVVDRRSKSRTNECLSRTGGERGVIKRVCVWGKWLCVCVCVWVCMHACLCVWVSSLDDPVQLIGG